jgi:hypothetical protein
MNFDIQISFFIQILHCIASHLQASNLGSDVLVLVGGFSTNDYLFRRITVGRIHYHLHFSDNLSILFYRNNSVPVLSPLFVQLEAKMDCATVEPDLALVPLSL